MRQPMKRRCSCVLTLKYTFICVYWWTRQRIHNTLIVVDRYLRLMGDKTIPDSAEPRLESFYPPFVAGIDLPHQGVVDSYNLHNGISYTGKTASLYWFSPQASICLFDCIYLTCYHAQIFHILWQNGRHMVVIMLSLYQYNILKAFVICWTHDWGNLMPSIL